MKYNSLLTRTRIKDAILNEHADKSLTTEEKIILLKDFCRDLAKYEWREQDMNLEEKRIINRINQLGRILDSQFAKEQDLISFSRRRTLRSIFDNEVGDFATDMIEKDIDE